MQTFYYLFHNILSFLQILPFYCYCFPLSTFTTHFNILINKRTYTHKYSCIIKCMQSTILFVYSLRRLLVVFLSFFLILFYCCYYCCHYSCSCCCYCFCFYYYSPLFCVYVNKHVEDEEKKYPRVSFSSFMIKITVTVYCCLCSCRLRSCFVYIQWQR